MRRLPFKAVRIWSRRSTARGWSPKRNTPSGSDTPCPAAAACDSDQFEAAAAKIGDDAIGLGNRRDDAQSAKLGLLGAREKAWLKAERGDPLEEVGAVGGIAHRGGGDDMEPLEANLSA